MQLQVGPAIILRLISMDDAIDIYNAINQQREYLGKWLPFVHITTELEVTQNFISSALKAPVDEREPIFTIRQDDVFVGVIGFKDTDKTNRKTEIGYWLLKQFQGQGIMTKVVDAVCTFAFDTLNLNRIQIKCAVGNTPSSNIPKRLGFVFEGIERAGERFDEKTFLDLEVYSRLKSD